MSDPPFLMSSTMIADNLRAEIQKSLPILMECLKDSSSFVRQTAVEALSSLAGRGTYH